MNERSKEAFFYRLSLHLKFPSNEKKTCLLLHLLCIFKFQTLTCRNLWIFHFMSRLTLYECVGNVCIALYSAVTLNSKMNY